MMLQDETTEDDFFDAIRLVCCWNDHFVFEAYCREWEASGETMITGYPQYILTSQDRRPRWATMEETESIMSHLSGER